MESKHSHMNFFGANTCSGSVSYTVVFFFMYFIFNHGECMFVCACARECTNTHTWAFMLGPAKVRVTGS